MSPPWKLVPELVRVYFLGNPKLSSNGNYMTFFLSGRNGPGNRFLLEIDVIGHGQIQGVTHSNQLLSRLLWHRCRHHYLLGLLFTRRALP